ncbi:hypothetical protein TNCV_1764271 [Trichonephila clavipes]|nr:hypothetical protein TNCV_1764271 [Trichonephila clavipes]
MFNLTPSNKLARISRWRPTEAWQPQSMKHQACYSERKDPSRFLVISKGGMETNVSGLYLCCSSLSSLNQAISLSIMLSSHLGTTVLGEKVPEYFKYCGWR